MNSHTDFISSYKIAKCLLFIWFCSASSIGGYVCTVKEFIRLGNSCYYISGEIATWQESHFRCRDKSSQLAVIATQYEDSTLKNYLRRPEFAQLGRWIGGMRTHKKWVWAAQGIEISLEMLEASSHEAIANSTIWDCLYMDADNRYNWSSYNCVKQLHYLCEAPLAYVASDYEIPKKPNERKMDIGFEHSGVEVSSTT